MKKNRNETERINEHLAKPRELVFYGGEDVQWLLEERIKLTTIRKANPKYNFKPGEIINLNVSDNEVGETLRAVVIANNKTTLSGLHQLELALDGYGRAETMIAYVSFQGENDIHWGSGMDAALEKAQRQALEDLQSFYPDLQLEIGEVNAISFLVLNNRLEKVLQVPAFANQIEQNDIIGLLDNPIFKREILHALNQWFDIQTDEALYYLDTLIATST